MSNSLSLLSNTSCLIGVTTYMLSFLLFQESSLNTLSYLFLCIFHLYMVQSVTILFDTSFFFRLSSHWYIRIKQSRSGSNTENRGERHTNPEEK